MKNMVWNVYASRLNSEEIEIYNIFDHGGFADGVKKLIKKKLPKEEFEEQLRRELSYYFWGRCQWEIVMAEFPARIKQEAIEKMLEEREDYKKKYGHYPYSSHAKIVGVKKIDVYEQVCLNWKHFVDYVWGQI